MQNRKAGKQESRNKDRSGKIQNRKTGIKTKQER
jgi:hypothetical protein